jgi:hypothetical protein
VAGPRPCLRRGPQKEAQPGCFASGMSQLACLCCWCSDVRSLFVLQAESCRITRDQWQAAAVGTLASQACKQ